jgi:hypothetical protein
MVLAVRAAAGLVAALLVSTCGGEEQSGSDGGGAGSSGSTSGGGSTSSGGSGVTGGSTSSGGSTSGGGSTSSGGSGVTGGSTSSGGSGDAGGAAGGEADSGGTAGTATTGGSGACGAPASGGAAGSVGEGGEGGAGATSGGTAQGGSGAASGAGGQGGAAGAGTCAEPCPTLTPECCGSRCVDTSNDPQNCGRCGNVCEGDTPYCAPGGNCEALPCEGASCDAAQTCCGDQCCEAGQLCCWRTAGCCTINLCHTPTAEQPTCPDSCRLCGCASPETPIATPQGERPISELGVGDLVYSVDHAAVVAVPIARVNRVRVTHHRVMRVTLENGVVLAISERHPTADGKAFGTLSAGADLGGLTVTSVQIVPYTHPFTYDILPASDTGTYFAGGALIGSTLGGWSAIPD